MGERAASVCSRFHRAVELIGRRWTGAMLQALLSGRMRYAMLRDAIPDISDRMLCERLRELEAEGIVRRIVMPETPVRVEYELTQKGRALGDALQAIGAWAQEWIPPLPAPGEKERKVKAAPAARRRRSA